MEAWLSCLLTPAPLESLPCQSLHLPQETAPDIPLHSSLFLPGNVSLEVPPLSYRIGDDNTLCSLFHTKLLRPIRDDLLRMDQFLQALFISHLGHVSRLLPSTQVRTLTVADEQGLYEGTVQSHIMHTHLSLVQPFGLKAGQPICISVPSDPLQCPSLGQEGCPTLRGVMKTEEQQGLGFLRTDWFTRQIYERK